MTLTNYQILLTFLFIHLDPFCSKEYLSEYFYGEKMLQLKDLEVYTVIRVIFQLAEEIPCISALVIALLSEVHLLKVFGVSGCCLICFFVVMCRCFHVYLALMDFRQYE